MWGGIRQAVLLNESTGIRFLFWPCSRSAAGPTSLKFASVFHPLAVAMFVRILIYCNRLWVASASCLSVAICCRASSRHFSRVPRRRNDAWPALARTRMPS